MCVYTYIHTNTKPQGVPERSSYLFITSNAQTDGLGLRENCVYAEYKYG